MAYDSYKYIHKPEHEHDAASVMDNTYRTMDSLKSKFVVKGGPRNHYRVYGAGVPYASEFFRDLEAMPVADRTFHEVIFSQPQKLRFDIDASHTKLATLINAAPDTLDTTSDTLDFDIESYLGEAFPAHNDNIADVPLNTLLDELSDTPNIPNITTKHISSIDEAYQYVFDAVSDAINAAFFIMYQREVPVIVTTQSHGMTPTGPIKSNHMIISGVYVSANTQAYAFARRVQSYLPTNCRQFLDMSIYKSIQNFRIIGCHKGDQRLKKLDVGVIDTLDTTTHTTTHTATPNDTLITNITGCELLPDIEMATTKTKHVDADVRLHADDIAATLELCARDGLLRNHMHKRTCGSVLMFDRKSASYCDICDREHVNDNSLVVSVAANTDAPGMMTVFKQCRRYVYDNGKDGRHFTIMGSFLSAIAPPAALVQHDCVAAVLAKSAAEKSAAEKSTMGKPITTALMFREWPQHTYAEPQLRPFELVDTLVVHAAMKMGKTKALTTYIAQHFADTLRPNNIRIVSFRQTFSGNIKEKFPEFTLYSDVTGPLTQARVIVQVESLWRLRIEAAPPDLLVLDECESIFEQFDSGLLRGNFNECFAKFQYLIKHSRHVVCMDAGLTNRTYRVLRAMRDKTNNLYHYNSYANATDDNYYITTDKARWLGMLYNAVDSDERIAVPMSSVSEARVLDANLRRRYPGKRVKLYSSETLASEKREHFTDVNTYWGELDILIYTPTVSAGVSFERKHFSKIFGYFTDKSCPVETCVQMIGRIRDVESHEHYICISATGNTLPTTPEQVHERLVMSRENLRTQFDTTTHLAIVTQYDAKGQPTIRTTDYYQLYVENTIIRNISKNSFIKWFVHAVGQFGAQIHQLDADVYREATGLELIVDGAFNEEISSIQIAHAEARGEITAAACERIATASDITSDDFEAIRSAMSTGLDVTTEQRAEFDKFRLRRAYDNYNGPIDAKFVDKFGDVATKAAYKNTMRLRSATHGGVIDLAQIQREELAAHEYLNEFEPLGEITRKYVYDKHRYAIGLLQLCGWTDLADPRQLHAVELSHRLRGKLFTDTVTRACAEFEIRAPRLANATLDKLLKPISNILSVMYGAKISRGHSDMYRLQVISFHPIGTKPAVVTPMDTPNDTLNDTPNDTPNDTSIAFLDI